MITVETARAKRMSFLVVLSGLAAKAGWTRHPRGLEEQLGELSTCEGEPRTTMVRCHHGALLFPSFIFALRRYV
jgi:hypothetical protein